MADGWPLAPYTAMWGRWRDREKATSWTRGPPCARGAYRKPCMDERGPDAQFVCIRAPHVAGYLDT